MVDIEGDVRRAAQDGIESGVRYLRAHSLRTFVPANLIDLNSAVVGATLSRRGLRTFDVERYAYTPASEIATEIADFAARLRTYGEPATRQEAIDRMFDIHWSLNLRGHYFFDACGRTATLLGCWVANLTCEDVPRLPPRDLYLQVPLARSPLDSWRLLVGES